ncbi:MAG: TetR family transcriptional regulator [Candidatus Melainabacteria bacterium]|nr:MAG: TetR family transcriptional regulator [Candidatus Melainabacteria bacterium]
MKMKTTSSRGRPRSEAGKRAILQAAVDLLEQRELPRITAEAIAGRAGVSKATLYRWWPNKAAVIMDAFLQITAPNIAFEQTLPVLERILDQMKKVARFYKSPAGRVFLALIGESQFDSELAQEFRERFVLSRRQVAAHAIQLAVEQGVFQPNIDVETTLDTLYAPIFYRLLVGYGQVDDEFVERVAAQVFGGILIDKNSREKGA